METMSLGEICAGLGIPCPQDAQVLDICTDTRKLTKGCVFVALIGEQFDGHDYVQDAFAAGAIAAVVQREVKGEGLLLQVESTETAFQTIAGLYRNHFSLQVVGLTGSIGKTTTKEMVYAVLSGFDKTLKTEKNLNNQFGTPQTLLGLDSSYAHAVIEMGMSGFGEIEALSKCVQPMVAMITNIGVSHIAYLGSREGILQAKLEILTGLKEGGKLLLCADDDLLFAQRNTFPFHTLTYGVQNQGADAYATDIIQSKNGAMFTIVYENKAYAASIPIPGLHNVQNAVGAFLAGVCLGYDPAVCAKHLSRYETSGMRQNIVKVKNFTVIEDCYNAGPDSMRSALQLLSTVADGGRTIAVLGDMLELGDICDEMHHLVGTYAAEQKIDMLFATGAHSEKIVAQAKAMGLDESVYFEDRSALVARLKEIAKKGDTFLFKASRGLKFEELLEEFYKGEDR